MVHGETEVSDPVEAMLKKTGCIELHYKVQVLRIVISVCSCVMFMFFFVCDCRSVLQKRKIGESVRMKWLIFESALKSIANSEEKKARPVKNAYM